MSRGILGNTLWSLNHVQDLPPQKALNIRLRVLNTNLIRVQIKDKVLGQVGNTYLALNATFSKSMCRLNYIIFGMYSTSKFSTKFTAIIMDAIWIWVLIFIQIFIDNFLLQSCTKTHRATKHFFIVVW